MLEHQKLTRLRKVKKNAENWNFSSFLMYSGEKDNFS